MNIEIGVLARLWPNARDELRVAVAGSSDAVFAKYDIGTFLRVIHFLAQISHESDGGTVTAESLYYTTPERIAAVWPSRFTTETARAYTRNPRLLADTVYNGRMGNRIGTDDGFNYRGRGLLQITGRASYAAIGAKVGLDLITSPELAFAPEHALEIAAAEFSSLGCLPYCDQDDIKQVTHHVNGGYIGLASREAWLAKWKAALNGE